MDFGRLFGKVFKGGVSGGTVLALISFLPLGNELKGAIAVVASAAIHGLTEFYNQRKG